MVTNRWVDGIDGWLGERSREDCGSRCRPGSYAVKFDCVFG